mmetsp:Transcript_37872/g.96963  ORF Transcript_37872/g.96963 Transcript_37872/m.96963 type:complete len:238 (-) Transcript_37872:70-783(-)
MFPTRMSLHVLAVVGLAWVGEINASFQEGEYVPTARRAQYQAKRTHWHDLLGRHCPRFGMDKVVAVPLPKPVDMWPDASLENFEYKLSLSFDGERYHTPWLYILGKKQTGVPLVEVELVRSGTHLQAVKAKVVTAPRSAGDTHKQLIEEFGDINTWPKHLLIQYKWTTINEIDVDRGLYVLFGSSLLLSAIAAFSVMRAYQAKLTHFLNDMAAEDFMSEVISRTSVPTVSFGTGKAD